VVEEEENAVKVTEKEGEEDGTLDGMEMATIPPRANLPRLDSISSLKGSLQGTFDSPNPNKSPTDRAST